jgi:RNA polymerase sigma-B factor
VEARDVLGPLLRTLIDRTRRSVVMQFFGETTQCEIAREFGLSQVQVSRLLPATLRKMGRALRAAPPPVDTRS